MSLINKINLTNIPKHVAVIMDGNGRWAEKINKPRFIGHKNGLESIKSLLKGIEKTKIPYVTLFAFSTENWLRPKEEIDYLFDLLLNTMTNELEEFSKKGIRILVIGNKNNFPKNILDAIDNAIEKTKDNNKLKLIFALDYGSKDEIISCVKKISLKVLEDKLKIEDIDESIIEQNLYTSGFPPVDLLIRTSGEQRISNFLLWQIAYAEIFFTPVLWPDFSEENFYETIIDFQSRERRYGKVLN